SGVFIYALPVVLLMIFVALDFFAVASGRTTDLDTQARIVIIVFLWSLIAIACTAGSMFASFRVRARSQQKSAYEMPQFFAALPLSTGDFVWTKLTALTTRMLGFCVVAVLACAWVALRGGLIDPGNGFMRLATPVIALVLFLLTGTADSMSFTLSGRGWSWLNRVHAARFLLLGLGASAVGSYWGAHKTAPPGLPEIVAVLAVVKIATLVVLVQYVGRRGL